MSWGWNLPTRLPDAGGESGSTPPEPMDPRQRSRDWMAKFRRAFAVDDGKPIDPTEAESKVVEKVVHEIVRRRMTTPAIIFLESFRPMNYIGAQAMHFFAPFAEVLIAPEAYRTFALFLERRGSVDYLCRRLEALESECEAKERGAKSKPEDKTEHEDRSG